MSWETDWKQTPFLTVWETTRACDLASRYGLEVAQPDPLPGELSTVEGIRLLHQIHEMGCPMVVLSGGDPLKRSDLSALIRYGKSLGLRVATTPAASHLLTRQAVRNLKETGLDQIAFSLDFPRGALQDHVWNKPGTFARTLDAIKWTKNVEMPVQINTTITSETLPHLAETAELVSRLGIAFWQVLFFVPPGRGEKLPVLTAQECESAFEILYYAQSTFDFALKVIEAPHYRRYIAQRNGNILPSNLRRSKGPNGWMDSNLHDCGAGNGLLFISYKGDVYPSGFLPISGGNVRIQGLSQIYRECSLFKDLRNSDRLSGRCGHCDFREICGGSRSRAYALTGDYLATDPWCAYQPPRLAS